MAQVIRKEGSVDEAKREAGLEFIKLAEAIQEAIITTVGPTSREVTPQGGVATKLPYDLDVVLSALSWSMASFIVQSGSFPTLRDRKRAVEALGRRVLAFCPEVERVVAEVGPTGPLKAN